ncbi:hypothetical protein OESDEN_25373 [Oesophagostomum dentatum]|uniref:Uncharacterized protein n=1 Tax=Oesophagostomum dentatum TaxID=61180 RepID=A0A0B1RTP7_OESDE|nr:hypothetical protein OESDEN_25373 [Oesophagostomum dentatum]
MQTEVKIIRDVDTLVVDTASGSPVCWDDMGVPLECDLEDKGWTQVGLLHTVMRNVDNRTNATLTDCNDITALVFSPFSDHTLPELLTRHTVQLLSAAKRCFQRPTVTTSEETDEDTDEQMED